MSAISGFILFFVLFVVTVCPSKDTSDLPFEIKQIRGSFYFLSNDRKNVSQARISCRETYNAQLYGKWTDSDDDIQQILASWGVTNRDRPWTAGQHDGEKWVWYDDKNNVSIPIANYCGVPWVGGICPESGCLAIGGRDLTYGYEADDCGTLRRYICVRREE